MAFYFNTYICYMKNTTLIILIILLSIWSCKKKTSVLIASTPQTYLPNTLGSHWKYDLNFPIPSTKEIYVTGRDTTFATSPNFIFNIMDAKSAGFEYQSKVNDDYYITVPGSQNHTPYKVIKGDAVVGEQWLGAVNGTDSYFVKLLEKDISFKMDTVVFPKTLHIQQIRKLKNGSIDMNLDTWVAYGVGIVKSSGTLLNFPYTSRLILADIR
jgi:hypothetical protein